MGDPVPWDDAMSAWVVMRFVFLWGVFGYLAVPILAQLRGVASVADLSHEDIAVTLGLAESMKALTVVGRRQCKLDPGLTPRC